MKKLTILFLAANPSGTDGRALDREARSIRAELKGSGHRDRFEFETRWAAEPLDLLRELRELKPAVVHFSGHGGRNGLFFQAPDGRAQLVSNEALAKAFAAAGASVKLVILNACYSEAQAEALLAHVDCVVGMSGSIHEDAARSFAIGFYGGLGEHESVAAAYKQGRAAISLEGLSDGDLPQLRVRAGADADRLVPAAATPPEPVELPCPYPGMRPYSADDAAHFHGRDAEIDDLLGRLRASEREIYVIGPSGSGKSSFVTAGVLPRLARGVAELGSFVVRSVRPGEQPAARLSEVLEVLDGELATPANAIAALLAHRAPGASVLIVIDQLEELFTLANSGEREKFLSALLALRTEPRCVAVFTLRADFFGAFMECPLWTSRHGRISRIEVGPLRGEALREAIVYPARDLGVSVEPELIERLFADAASEPGILPLLQETLVQLWGRRRGRLLTLADYQALGDGDRSGLAVALSRRADATLRALTPAQEAIARRILLRLISFGEGRSDTRRQQPRSKLRAADDDVADFDAVLRHLIADRLLTTDDDDGGDARVDLAHEVMIAAWLTLAGWVQTRRADEQHRRQLEAAAAQWVERRRGAGGLLDPIELAEAESWRRTEVARELGESSEVAELVAASRAAHAKQRRRLRGLVWSAFTTLAVFAFIVTMLAILARHQAKQAEVSGRQSRRHLALLYRETGRQLVLDLHSPAALPYLVAARAKGEEGPPLRMLFWAATRSLPLTSMKEQDFVKNAAFSSDGKRFATCSGKIVHIRDVDSGRPLAPPLWHPADVHHAAFSPQGTRVVTASADEAARIWDVSTGRPLVNPLQHQGWVRSAAFNPDGTRIVTVSGNTARVWDAETGKPLANPLVHRERVNSAAFSPDGTRVVTASADKTANLWDAATGKLLTAPLVHHGFVNSAAFSPDGTRVLTASSDHTAHIWNAATGKLLAEPLAHPGLVNSAVFSPDGTRVVTASDDKTARIWNTATGSLLGVPLEHRERVHSAAFSPDGTRVVTASDDKTTRVWDAVTGKALTPSFHHPEPVAWAAFNVGGTRVVTATYDFTVRVWDAAAGKPLAIPLRHQASVTSAAFSSDGKRVVTVSGNTAHVWNAMTGEPMSPPLQHRAAVNSAAFSSDGKRVVTASADNTAGIWDLDTGKLPTGTFPTLLEHQADVRRAEFSPDDKHVVTASADKTARVWDAVTGKRISMPLEHGESVVSAAFNADGTRVVTASADETARVWDAITGEPISPPLEHRERVVSAAFSLDRTRVVTASFDHTVRLWDAITGKSLVTLEHERAVFGATFSPDSTRVITASDDNTARVWDAAGNLLATLFDHKDTVNGAAFSPDGTRVVTASADKTARVWDAATGKPLTVPLEHHGFVNSAVFSPDGNRIVTTSTDKTACIWEIPLDQRSLEQWSELARQSPFVLSDDGVFLREAGRD